MPDDIVIKTSAPVANQLRKAYLRLAEVKVEDVDWGVAEVLNQKVKQAIVSAFNSDLYLDPEESSAILGITDQEDRAFVGALLFNLRNHPPLLSRTIGLQKQLAKPTCSALNPNRLFGDCATASQKEEWRREISQKIKPALARASQDFNPVLAERAQSILNKLK